ncbi:MAG TPA: DNA-binding response regulator [Gemmatimonas aurantiaca]|uniref:LytT family two-component response regulator n=2 Tax=Gemmatimonas aurantiaca TaxID=173480 RepID=C1AAC5_GEMAT|nr:LytTR family DNA-binding domain-containing protein [Gemmatimonas aurantiaca]BAH39723.1 LytT family two-component response regulator [Gemmatimonas aurantiaca T-27]HCT58267.1 DNA-binding response regulator [Gemmatimonas aurantiaca]
MPRLIRALIVDDEPLGRRRLRDLLAASPDIEIVGESVDGTAAMADITALAPDLVFLDIQMPRGSGLDVVRAMGPDRMPITIFVTAHDAFALQAFDAAAVDYLLKPFSDERFADALKRARRLIALEDREQLHAQLRSLLDMPSPPADNLPVPNAPAYLERIAVQMRGRMRVVPVGQIDYIVANEPYAELHVGTERYLIRDSLQRLEERLDPARFIRVHRATIVRIDVIDTLLRGEGSDYQLVLRNGVRLRVGRSRREALEALLGRVRAR